LEKPNKLHFRVPGVGKTREVAPLLPLCASGKLAGGYCLGQVQEPGRSALMSVNRISVPANRSSNSEPIPTITISTKKTWRSRRSSSCRSIIEHQCRVLRYATHQPFTPRRLTTSIHRAAERNCLESSRRGVWAVHPLARHGERKAS
jgi:hypothetical protein